MSTAEIVAVEMAAVGASLALSAGLGGAGIALQGLGGLAAAGADWMQAKQDRARRYEQIVRDVLDRHARIDALGESARRAERDHGVAPAAIPRPLCYEGQDPDQLTAWCADTDAGLAQAEEALSTAIAQAMTARLMAAGLMETGGSGGHGLVTDARSTLPEDAGERAELAAGLSRVLSRLPSEAVAADAEAVRAAAARVAGAATAAEAQSRLTDVRVRVQEASTRAAAAREAALTAARCLRGLNGYQAPGVPEVRAALAEVVAGSRPLDEPLHTRAAELVAAAQAERERRYIAATLTSALAGLGYEVGEGFETLTARDGEVFITRGDWPAHAVKLKLGEDQQLRFAMVRTRNGATRQDQHIDSEREHAWCQSFEEVRTTMAEHGVRTHVGWRLEPGTQKLPVAGRTVAPAAAQRHRERET
jgi:hypothetical protein